MKDMVEKTDHELIYGAQGGDRASFSMLVERHYRFMFKVAWQWCGTKEDAEDIAQEAAIKMARYMSDFRFESAFTTWLYRLVINTAKDFYKAKNRKSAREGALYEDVEYVSPDLTPEQKMMHKDVLKAIAALPEKQRAAVLMHKYEEMEYSQIAKVLNCSESAVKSLLFRAYEALRARLAHMA